MIHIWLEYHKYRSYTESSGCIVAGQGFYQDRLYRDKEFKALVSSWSTEEDFVAGIRALNGFYVLICKKGSKLFAAVDRVRSIPLFYGCIGSEFWLSDCAEWVRIKIGDMELDPLAKKEFLLTGYVTGRDTLFPDVKQIQAGEVVIVDENNGQIQVKAERYYRFGHGYEQEANIDELMAQAYQMLVRIFNRLVEVADGRTVVVPLSGGYDSRLIVLMLKLLGYENIVTFTYGCPGNKESEVSRKVAGILNLQWEFVPYSNEEWYRWYNSHEMSEYHKMAGSLSSTPHILDWPAVYQLKKGGVVTADSIFVPGHTPMLSLVGRPTLRQSSTDSVFTKHYSLQEADDHTKKIMKNRISDYCKINRFDTSRGFYKWECAERQSKFIANSVRVYEFWGFNWYMPYWDSQFFDFCLALPEKQMVRKKFFKSVVDRLSKNIMGCTLPRDDLSPPYSRRLRNMLSLYLSDSFKAKLKKVIKNIRKDTESNEFYSHPMAGWGCYARSEKECIYLQRKFPDYISPGSDHFIKNLENSMDD